MLTNITFHVKGSKSVPFTTTGHGKLRIILMLSILVDRRKLTSFVILTRSIFQTQNFLMELYLTVMRKDEWQGTSWSNG
jgi:hypothetical protein